MDDNQIVCLVKLRKYGKRKHDKFGYNSLWTMDEWQ
jgi:hypothetical protein